MPHGLPSIGRQSYVHIKLQRDTHTLWVELKASPKLKCDDALACYLLTSIVKSQAVAVRIAKSRKV